MGWFGHVRLALGKNGPVMEPLIRWRKVSIPTYLKLIIHSYLVDGI